MFLVAGASGLVGGEACRLLRAQGHPVRALIRRTTDPARIRTLRALGVATVVGDLRDRRSLDTACRGVDAVVSAVSTFRSQDPTNSMQTVECQGQIHLIDAARASGVEHFVPSSYGTSPSRFGGRSPLVDAKSAAERHLIRSGLAYTILYNGPFMESWLSPLLGFHVSDARARVYGSGRNPLSWISYRNVAQAIVASLTDLRLRNEIVHLSGPPALTPLEVVRVFEEEEGRRFEVEFVPEDALDAMEAGARHPLQKTVAAMLQELARGHVISATEMHDELRMKWVSVRDYARSLSRRRMEAAPMAAAG